MKFRSFILLTLLLFFYFLFSCHEEKKPAPVVRKKINCIIKNTTETPHKISVIHKGISLTKPTQSTLIEIQNNKKQPIAYYMNVKSVVCGNQRCRVDVIKVCWDKLGRYSHIELPEGVELEKKEGEDFTDKDYKKLDVILSDPNSPLQNVYKNEIVNTIGSEGVDALTGATILLDKSSYVEGAVWTCYSIWHWIHGESKQILRNITGDSFSMLELKNYLKSDEKHQQLFAVEQFTRRKNYSEATKILVAEEMLKKPYLIKSCIPYLNDSPNIFFRNTMQALIANATTTNRLICLNEVLKTKQQLPTSFFNNVNLDYSTLTFEEVHLLLKIFNSRQLLTDNIKHKLISLLNSNHFLIARRVYWFLKDLTLTEEQKTTLEAFYNTNKERM